MDIPVWVKNILPLFNSNGGVILKVKKGDIKHILGNGRY